MTQCILFYLQLLIIITVSVIDIFYTLLTRETILAAEQNPIAKWVIQRYGVDKFICIKTATTCLVVLIIQWFYYNTKDKNKKAMWVILGSITFFQIGLLMWLTTPPSTWRDLLRVLGLYNNASI
jgi:hypothetical protein